MKIEDHNAAKWLVVRFVPSVGWFVCRSCRCHLGKPVTIPLDSEERAERARHAMLAVSRRLGVA